MAASSLPFQIALAMEVVLIEKRVKEGLWAEVRSLQVVNGEGGLPHRKLTCFGVDGLLQLTEGLRVPVRFFPEKFEMRPYHLSTRFDLNPFAC